MKKYIIFFATALVALCSAVSCREADELNPVSVITVDKVDYTPFDYWLEANFVIPYNIQIKYRYEEIEADLNYYTVPAQYEYSIVLAHLVKYLCVEAYDEAGGIEFTRANFPKLFFFIGDWEYKNNGTYILGTAAGGRKVKLCGVNYLGDYLDDFNELSEKYFKTVHHEFTHILNQNKPMPTAFQFVTGDSYIADEWNNAPYDTGYLGRGFITSYAQHSHGEDFAEMVSKYVCNSPEQWEAWMQQATAEAEEAGLEADPVSLITTKLDLVKAYLKESYGVDLDVLRNAVQTRQANIAAGKIDLFDITVK